MLKNKIIKPCIGIISYLPDDEEFRKFRLDRCKNLIAQCDEIFNIPIIIICQNYKGDVLNSTNLIRYDYEKLGIFGARDILRQIFLESDFNYIILLDDDAEIVGNYEEGQKLLQKLSERPNTYFSQNFNLLSGTMLSKKLFSIVEIPPLHSELGEGFEDASFFQMLLETVSVGEVPMSGVDITFIHKTGDSTWCNEDIVPLLSDMDVKTREWCKNKLKELKEKYGTLPLDLDKED